jgi:2-hydroxychromene-2-carboxylate isomerase
MAGLVPATRALLLSTALEARMHGIQPGMTEEKRKMSKLDFWYEFASTYSYLAAMRIEPLVKAAGVEVVWRPFLLGPIFKAQGWETSPFLVQEAKGKHMWRDLARLCEDAGLPPFRQPENFPARSLLAARVALALNARDRPAFSRAVYTAEFAEGEDIADRKIVAAILQKLGHDAHALLAKTEEKAVKNQLRANTEEAQRLGIFGAPSFVLENGEMFWGNDRLEQALAWTRRQS